MRQLARVEKFADQKPLGEWLRQPSDASLAALWRHIAEFVQWVIARAEPARWTHAGRAEAFFDDTPIEVFGPSFERAKINYNGHLALSWQTFWFGPFLVGGELGSPGDAGAARASLIGAGGSGGQLAGLVAALGGALVAGRAGGVGRALRLAGLEPRSAPPCAALPDPIETIPRFENAPARTLPTLAQDSGGFSAQIFAFDNL